MKIAKPTEITRPTPWIASHAVVPKAPVIKAIVCSGEGIKSASDRFCRVIKIGSIKLDKFTDNPSISTVRRFSNTTISHSLILATTSVRSTPKRTNDATIATSKRGSKITTANISRYVTIMAPPLGRRTRVWKKAIIGLAIIAIRPASSRLGNTERDR